MKTWQFPNRREQASSDDVILDDPRAEQQDRQEIEADHWADEHDDDVYIEDDEDEYEFPVDEEDVYGWERDRNFVPNMNDERVSRESRLYYLDDDPECPF